MFEHTHPKIAASATFLAVLVLWLLGGMALHRAIITHNNDLYLNETSQQLMRRAEKTVDLAVIAYTEFKLSGGAVCDAATQETLRDIVLNSGVASGAFVITPGGACSGFGDLSIPLPNVQQRSNWHPANNPEYLVGRYYSERDDSDGLVGISRGLGTDLEFVMAINTNALLYDALPNELRVGGRIVLSIAGDPVGIFGQTEGWDRDGWPRFMAQGARYPLKIDLFVDPDALADWHADIHPLLTAIWLAIGIGIATLAAIVGRRLRDHHLAEVKAALKSGKIIPYFQPIVDLSDNRIIACEVLARWIRPDGSMIPPDRFIPLIERHKLDDQLLACLMAQSTADLGDLFATDASLYLSLNITPDQLSRDGFADTFKALVSKNNLPPQNVCIEITERQVIADPEIACENARQLKAAGFRIAVDDAGTGHNGLAAIQTLSISVLKIDKFFVDPIVDDPGARVMLDMFASLAARSGMISIAEGIESKQQIALLRAAGIRAGQGYVFAKPLSADEFRRIVADNNDRATTTANAVPLVSNG